MLTTKLKLMHVLLNVHILTVKITNLLPPPPPPPPPSNRACSHTHTHTLSLSLAHTPQGSAGLKERLLNRERFWRKIWKTELAEAGSWLRPEPDQGGSCRWLRGAWQPTRKCPGHWISAASTPRQVRTGIPSAILLVRRRRPVTAATTDYT